MTAPLTVLIPTLNAADTLADTAASLVAGVTAGVVGKLIVSDGGSTDATQDIALGLGARWVSGASGRGNQIALALSGVQGWVLIIHADTWLAPDWTQAIAPCLDDPRRAYWGHLAFRAPGAMARFVAAWANFRSARFGLPYGDQALLIHTDLLGRVGGYPPIALMEDVALARKLRGALAPMGVIAYTSAEKYQAQGWVRRGARNLWILTRYLIGADPERLAQIYDAAPRGRES